MTRKYNIIMDKIVLSQEMRIRILNDIGNKDLDNVIEINISQKNFDTRKQLKFAAAILVICVGAVAASKVINTTTEPPVQVVPQIFEYETPEELSKAVGFVINQPSSLPFTPKETKYVSYWGNIAEIIYINGTSEITFRMSTVSQDISGDYTNYGIVKSKEIGNALATIKGDESGYQSATWSDSDYSYSLSSTTPLSEDEIMDLISSIH